MNRIQCGRVPKRKYSVPDESVNFNGRGMVLIPKETFLNMDQKLKMLSESRLLFLVWVCNLLIRVVKTST